MTNPRTIVLTIIQINNDIVNQGIIQKSRRFDQIRKRIVKIIIKFDFINEDTQKRIALLIKNENIIKLKLDFFLIKNPTLLKLKNEITFD